SEAFAPSGRPPEPEREFDAEPVANIHELMNTVALLPPGKTVAVEVQRTGKALTLNVTVAQREVEKARSDEAPPRPGGADLSELGFTAKDLTPQSRRLDAEVKRGAIVPQVQAGSLADRTGLRPGDVILEVDRKAVSSANELRTALGAAGRERGILLLVERNGH